MGACSATIVRCRYKRQLGITIRFRYFSKEKFDSDLDKAIKEAENALTVEEESPEKKREIVCDSLSRFLRLFGIEKEDVVDKTKLISLCRERGQSFKERHLLGTEERLTVTHKNEKQIQENLSARGRRAFIVDECVIEGSFPKWHPQMELIDMPGTNALDPWHEEVKARLKQEISGLVIVTKETQIKKSELDWFEKTSILQDVVGSSKRNQTRVFLIKTFVDQLNLPEEEDSPKSKWEATKDLCQEIESYLRKQMLEVVSQRYSAENELEVLHAFVNGIPIHFVSPKVCRNLADKRLRNRVLKKPMDDNNIDLYQGFLRFDKKPENAGIPDLRKSLNAAAEKFITDHFLNRLRLEFEKEVGEIVRFFRKVELEQGLSDKKELVLQVVEQIEEKLAPIFKQSQEEFEERIVDLKNRFRDEVEQLQAQVTKGFRGKVKKKLDDCWDHLHWASLRAAGRKDGHHITYRGIEIDFNGKLADFCVEVLNSKWIDYRGKLKGFYDNLLRSLLPQLEKTLAQVKGCDDEERQKLIEPTYEDVVASACTEVELQAERYDSETEKFDALRPELIKQIKEFLLPTYEKIADERGSGSSYRMKDHLREGITDSTCKIDGMVKDVVRKNWEGLTGGVEDGITKLFSSWEKQFADQGVKLREIAERPSDGDDQRVRQLREIEKLVERWKGKQIV